MNRPYPVSARHIEPSLLLSADDDLSRPSERLFDIALRAISTARHISLQSLSRRMVSPPFYPEVWPGEHYRLLAALVEVLQCKVVIEIGTATGLSALAMREKLPLGGVLHTFDIIPAEEVPGSVLGPEDLSDGRIVRHTDDLREIGTVVRHQALIEAADLVFVDAAKDGAGEDQFIVNLRRLSFRRPPIVVFDDIRLWNMLRVWREISAPKLDLTSFGHWSGTGLVDWVWD